MTVEKQTKQEPEKKVDKNCYTCQYQFYQQTQDPCGYCVNIGMSKDKSQYRPRT